MRGFILVLIVAAIGFCAACMSGAEALNKSAVRHQKISPGDAALFQVEIEKYRGLTAKWEKLAQDEHEQAGREHDSRVIAETLLAREIAKRPHAYVPKPEYDEMERQRNKLRAGIQEVARELENTLR